MIELGVFARVFPAGTAAEVGAAILAASFTATQLNLSALGRATLDTTLTAGDARQISGDFTAAGVRIWGLSGTFNAVHPDRQTRVAATEACRRVIARAPDIGAEVVTVCTGTRDPDNMWRAHPDNDTPTAWSDLRATLDALVPAAVEANVRLGVEPEPGNVVRDVDAAHRLLTELGDDARHLAIVLDPANLLEVATLGSQRQILERAFDLLGPTSRPCTPRMSSSRATPRRVSAGWTTT